MNRAIDSIPADAWVPVQYPGVVKDPDTGAWISDAEVAGVAYTAFAGTERAVTARLVVRRVRDRNIGPEDETFHKPADLRIQANLLLSPELI